MSSSANGKGKKVRFGSYEELAAEYYDALRHPTCANFREASAKIIYGFLRAEFGMSGLICEVGAGKSVVAEILSKIEGGLERLVITDSSPAMLSHSRQWESFGARLWVADAHRLPLSDSSVSCVISSLGDPYNLDEFWQEARRVLVVGGCVAFTTPSYEWATAFRAWSEAATFEGAEFEVSNGERVCVRSIIHEPTRQVALMESMGFELFEVAHVRVSELKATVLSPKIKHGVLLDPIVVTGYLGRKR